MKCIMGIDTSCYTTSVAIIDENGRLLADARKLLLVRAGGRGLQQSEMVFQHTRNLPEILEQAVLKTNFPLTLKAIGVSAYPRPLSGSYMPAFLVGLGYAKALALSHNIPLYQISHQENHIWAGIYSAQGPYLDEFLAIHLSGGTTELVKVKKEGCRLSLTLLGGTLDISAGQLIDRVGVALKFPFPAGPHLEKIALANNGVDVKIPYYVNQFSLSFSGSETYVKKLISKGNCKPESIAAGVQCSVAMALAKLIANGTKLTGINSVLFVGGVISNQFIRQYLINKFPKDTGINLYFPETGYSSDNSIGAAFFASQQ